uniref:Na+/proline symporter n=1 Tax=Candidatus Kentrum sp. LPFa TaxID=2126335 RepID=A0A450WSD4_9GAMM|nr:MAG: hypothetical protein BECKLPF1236B_GA0070989_11935 [Candidatus Kentron sp. LPFa]
MSITLLFIAVLIGPILYLVVTLAGEKPKDYDDYHYGGRSIPLHKFADATVTYAIQVAAITLFATWGYNTGLWTIWVPIFWAMGYFLIAYLLEKGSLDSFLQQESLGTIHQFVSDKGKLRFLGALAALASLLGIAGPAMFEAQYVGELVVRIGSASLPSETAISIVDKYSPLFFVSFLILASIYMLYGGFRAIVNTDVYQLGIGYSGFSIVLSILLYSVAESGYKFSSVLILSTLFSASAALLFYWKKVFTKSFQVEKEWVSELPLYIGLISYGSSLIISVVMTDSVDSFLSANTWTEFSRQNQIFNPLSLGGMSILSLLIANSLYQVVDIGQWQRLASVQMDKANYGDSRKKLASTIRMTGTYSAFTWVVAVFFGMTLKYLSSNIASNPYDATALFLIQYAEGSAIQQFVVFLMLVSLVAIMFSTLDSLVSSITFTIHNDWLVSLNDKFKTIAVGRLFTAGFLLMAFYLYGLLSARVNNFADILYSCWAFQIALLPIVFVALKKGTIPGWWAVISLLGGMIGAIIPVSFPEYEMSPYEFAPILSLAIASILMGIGVYFSRTDGGINNAS